MSSIPLPPDSSASAIDWRALRASVERGMLRERGSLRGRMRRLEDASRGGKDVSSEIGKLLADVQQSESQARPRQARLRKSRTWKNCPSARNAARSPIRFTRIKS